ncbi:MAG: PIN domain-containing protein [Marinoscillum sp.]|uniref:PIN domain-containing protein n=1 Tax=Marinoscillum sp. TaxID=2024838 RepID=UPI0032F462E1
MILVDTSVWISFLRNSDPDLSAILKSYLKRKEIYAVSAVFGELLQGVKNKRERALVLSLWENLPAVNESDLFIKAGDLSNKHKFYAHGIGLIDCYILAAALNNDLALWTLDKKLGAAADSLIR